MEELKTKRNTHNGAEISHSGNIFIKEFFPLLSYQLGERRHDGLSEEVMDKISVQFVFQGNSLRIVNPEAFGLYQLDEVLLCDVPVTRLVHCGHPAVVYMYRLVVNPAGECVIERNSDIFYSLCIFKKISPLLLRLHIFEDFPLRVVLHVLTSRHHEEELPPRLENFVKQTDGCRLVGDPVEAGEGGDQGEGGEVGGGEGLSLTHVQLVEGGVGSLAVLSAVTDHIRGDVHPHHLPRLTQRAQDSLCHGHCGLPGATTEIQQSDNRNKNLYFSAIRSNTCHLFPEQSGP